MTVAPDSCTVLNTPAVSPNIMNLAPLSLYSSTLETITLALWRRRFEIGSQEMMKFLAG
jgi:hypothetical protein